MTDGLKHPTFTKMFVWILLGCLYLGSVVSVRDAVWKERGNVTESDFMAGWILGITWPIGVFDHWAVEASREALHFKPKPFALTAPIESQKPKGK